MSDKLKDLINTNRHSFDSYEPRDLWSAIDADIKIKSSFIQSKIIQNMIKYGFGASALIVGTLLVINPQNERAVASAQKPFISSGSMAPSPITPKTNGDELVTEFKKQNAVPSATKVPAPVEKPIQLAQANVPSPAKSAIPSVSEVSASPDTMSGGDDPVISGGYTLLDTIFKGIKKIEVMGDFCNISVHAREGEGVSLHGRIGEGSGDILMFGKAAFKKRDYKIKYEKKDGVLKVWIEHVNLKHRVRVSGSASEMSVLDFEVPAKTEVDLSNHSGDLSVSGLINDHISLNTQFGDIKAENMTSALTLKSSSGNITLNKIKGDVKTESSFGNQLIGDITGNVKLRSSSGNITVKQLSGNAEVTSRFGYQKYENVNGNIVSIASSGEIIVKHVKGNVSTKSSFGKQDYEDVEGDINSRASSGDIKINGSKGTLLLGTSFGSIIGKNVMLNSNSEFKTSSGDIRMGILNDMKDLSFDLQTSSGQLVIEKDNVKNHSDKKLVVGQGAIHVKGVSSFGNQNYR